MQIKLMQKGVLIKLDSFTLKIIALLLMIVDHICLYFEGIQVYLINLHLPR